MQDLTQHLPDNLLFATLSGAHLYGFESPDSDVDLRGAFLLPKEDLLGLKEPKETRSRTFVHEGLEIDIVLHDLNKYCRLLLKRSGEVLEQLYSTWVIRGGPVLEQLRELIRPQIVRPFYFHYRGFLANQLRFVEKPEATLKELLYGYRVALSGIHLLKSGQMLSHLPSLLELYPQNEVADLVAEKQSTREHQPLSEAQRGLHQPRLLELQAELEAAYQNSSLPIDGPGIEDLNAFVVSLRCT
jgi:predicted nucleotidyltransferase